ncbi:MAG TPA: neutral zinc metallopeptidase [Terriglobia bacterium]|nr:neutral zinc metallopeptidase [Terriglobia bacterium]
MRWTGSRQSPNVEDRRGMTVGRGLVGGGLGAILLLLLALILGIDPRYIFEEPSFDTSNVAPPANTPADAHMKDFVATVLGYTEDTWSQIFQDSGRTYRDPKLVLFSGAVDSACGFGRAAMGPFYCPLDEKVYLDMSFFDDLSQRFNAPGDFAEAYVIAHEIGHHVQNLLGISDQVDVIRQQNPSQANAVSVLLELQADCFAGIWANRTQRNEEARSREFLEPGDAEEALRAASMIGDDRLQMEARGYIVPESFTHGSARQRLEWFKRGFSTGSMKACDTFNADHP